MWIPILRPTAEKTLLDWLSLPVTALLSLVVFFLLGWCLFLVWPVAFLMHYMECRRLKRWQEALAEQGRLLSWSDVEPKLQAGEGSLILRNGAFGFASGTVIVGDRPVLIEHSWELWWIADRPPDLLPAPFFVEDEQIYCVELASDTSFEERYLKVARNGASLVRTSEAHPEEAFLPRHLKQRYPQAAIILCG